MSELDFYNPITDNVRVSPVGCPILPEIPATYTPEKPWQKPLSEQPKGRLHKSKRNMIPVVLIAQYKAGENDVRPHEVRKEAFGRNGIQQPVTVVRFK